MYLMERKKSQNNKINTRFVRIFFLEKDNARSSMNFHDNSAGVFLGTTKYKINFFLFDDAIRIVVENMNVSGFRILIKIIILWSMFN